MRSSLSVHAAALAGTLAVSLLGATAGMDRAQAMPVAPRATASSDAATTVAYSNRDHYDRGYHHYLRRFGKAGLYTCGPMALKTRLQKQACGANSMGRPGY